MKMAGCPVCGEKLEKATGSKSFSCANGHTFDVAKQGYVNLLTVSEKSSKTPGDSREMVAARRAFLGRGYYKGVSDEVNGLVAEAQGSLGLRGGEGNYAFSVLDIGCGEGYYTHRILESLRAKGVEADVCGVDISKEAVRLAAASYKGPLWIVGNSFRLPVASSSVDCAVSVFSPIKGEEVRRVMRHGGRLIRVLPGKDHLIEIRRSIYDEVREKDHGAQAAECLPLHHLGNAEVRYEVGLSGEEVSSLLMMTPHYHRSSGEDRRAFENVDEMKVTIHMIIAIYEKESSPSDGGGRV